MHTTCPECSSVFRVTAEQLNIAHGQVRCGYCHTVFDALSSLEEDWKEKLPDMDEPIAEDEQVEHVLVVDDEILNEMDFEQIEKPEVYQDDEDLPLNEILSNDYKPATPEENNEDPLAASTDDAVDDEPSALSLLQDIKKTPSELEKHDIKKQSDSLIEKLQQQIKQKSSADEATDTSVEPSQAAVETNDDDFENIIANDRDIREFTMGTPTHEDINELHEHQQKSLQVDDTPDILREELAAISAPATESRSYLWLAGILLLTATLLIQALYYFRDDMARDENYRGLAVTLCEILSCELPLRNDAAEGKKTMAMRSHSINPIAGHDDQLRINMIFTNIAEYTQAYPILSIKMTDESQTVTAIRYLSPEKYLGPHIGIKQGLPAKTSVEVIVDIFKPELPVFSYQFEFH